MDDSLTEDFRISETIPDELEMSQVFRDYKAVLRATGFKTPLQRAHTVAKKLAVASVNQKRMADAEGLRALLPPGPTTVHNVDIVRILANATRTYTVRVPITLLWYSGKARVVINAADGAIRVKSAADLKTGLALFFNELPLAAQKSQKFVVKADGEGASCFATSTETEEFVLAKQSHDLRVQPKIEPVARKTSQLRAHWSQGRTRNVYYAKIEGPMLTKTPPCLARRMQELSRSFTSCESHLSTNKQMMRMRRKPIPDIDWSLSESVRALNDALKPQSVTHILCDFVQDCNTRWVLVSCQGYVYTEHKKAISQVVELKYNIDMNFFLFPLFTKKEILSKKMQAVRMQEDEELHRASVLKERASSTVLQPQQVRRRPLQAKPSKPLFTFPEIAFINHTVGKYDRMVAGVTKYKEQINATIDFVARYGDAFWEQALQLLFRAYHADDSVLGRHRDSLNFEEQCTMMRGYKRILQGNYNFYYESVLSAVHSSMEITHSEYEAFLKCTADVLLDVQLHRRDFDIIFKRFRDLRNCICYHGK